MAPTECPRCVAERKASNDKNRSAAISGVAEALVGLVWFKLADLSYRRWGWVLLVIGGGSMLPWLMSRWNARPLPAPSSAADPRACPRHPFAP
ncbi:MAG: hypothetical protein JWM10_1864 [Myxococcaceae bacterium]|nr:hypothetical protein [Myxococcaceae bacterium]